MSENKTTAVAVAENSQGLQLFSSAENYELGIRMAKALYTSQIVPPSYQGQNNMGSCIIALDMASRMGISPLVCMQNLAIIKNKPSWGASFLIARLNMSGKTSCPVQYEWFGDEGKDDWGCRAWVKLIDGTKITGTKITIATAKGEGWYSQNKKWQTIPGQMLMYRAASFLIRANFPEIAMGLVLTTEEVEDMGGKVIDVPAHDVQEVDVDKVPENIVKDGGTIEVKATVTSEPMKEEPKKPKDEEQDF